MAHVLVVGGTGMLKKVSLFLAQHDNVVSVVSRTPENLEKLQFEASELNGKVNPLLVDYRNGDRLKQMVEDAIEQHGPIMLALNWVSADSLETSDKVAEVLNDKSPVCRFFQIMPSISDDSSHARKYMEDPFSHLEKVLYRKITLGIKHEQGMSRWLTNDEISEGVIEALRDDDRNAVIGTIVPWEERPASA